VGDDGEVSNEMPKLDDMGNSFVIELSLDPQIQRRSMASMLRYFATPLLLMLALCFSGCEPPPDPGSPEEFRELERKPAIEENNEEFDDHFDEDPRFVRLQWAGDPTGTTLKPGQLPHLTIESETDLPIEVVVRERWDDGGLQDEWLALGSHALDQEGLTLDLEVGTRAIPVAGSTFSSMLKVSVDIYDSEGLQLATVHSQPRFFHDQGGSVVFYDEATLRAEYNSGHLQGRPINEVDENGNPVDVVRVMHGGSGIVGKRIELGQPDAGEVAP
jgi:hypothetical protein